MTPADGGDERRYSAHLLVLADLLARTGLHPAEVDQRRALVYRAVNGGHRGGVLGVRALI